jgi:hypothetical protein
MRRLTTCFAALALAFAACGDDTDDTGDAATTTTTAEVTTTTGAETTTTTTTATTEPDDELELTQSCSSPDGFTISYPEDWDAVADCSQFGPAPLEEPAPNTDERTGVVLASVEPVAVDEVAEAPEQEQDREETTVGGRDAVRVESVLRGGMYPDGTDSVRWLIDVGDGRTLFLDAVDLDGFDVDFDEAVEVLDAMAESIELDA